MLLRIIKQISPATVARIKQNQTRLALLFNLRDAAFLREDLLAKNLQALDKGHYYLKTLLHRNIGPLVTPEYGLIRSNIGNISYFQNLGVSSLEEVYFTLRLIRNNEDPAKVELATFVAVPLRAWKEFSFDPFHGGTTEGRGNILAVATYFYNKKAMYAKTQAFLLEEKLALAAALGEAYTSDLLSLFAANKREKAIKNFAIPKENLSKEVLPYGRKDPKDLFRQKCEQIDFAELPFYPNNFSWSDLEVDLYLGPANTLILDAMYQETAGSPSRAPKVAARLTRFADEQLNAWLKDLEQLTAFGLAIYEGLKPKILLGTL